jgi:nitrogen fixation NifU-like protein
MDLNDLYRDVIVDHNRSPRNFRQIEPPRREADGFNPLCGDKLHVYLRISDDRIEDAAFEGSGCAISVASASMMTEFLKGKTEAEALDLFERMHELLTGEEADLDELASLGKLAALSGGQVCQPLLAHHEVRPGERRRRVYRVAEGSS